MRLRNRFRVVSNRAMRRQRSPHVLHSLRAWGIRLALLTFALALVWFTITSLSPWPVPLTVQHYLASHDCDSARAVGLAPARRGEPGYWPDLDADHDGIACETWPPAHRRARR